MRIWSRRECTLESYYTTGKQKKIDCFSVDGYSAYCDTVIEAIGCYFHSCPCQESRASLSEEEMQRGIRKREHDGPRRDYLTKKDTISLMSGSLNGGKELKKRKMSEIT